MKRLVFSIVLVLFGLGACGECRAAVYEEMWAMKTDWYTLPLVGKLEHVYVSIKRRTPFGMITMSYANPKKGGSTGGTTLPDSTGWGDIRKALCAATGAKCNIDWGRTGTCHQGANRILLSAGKTVYMAGGYDLSHWFFKAYGRDDSWIKCKQNCQLQN